MDAGNKSHVTFDRTVSSNTRESYGNRADGGSLEPSVFALVGNPLVPLQLRSRASLIHDGLQALHGSESDEGLRKGKCETGKRKMNRQPHDKGMPRGEQRNSQGPVAGDEGLPITEFEIPNKLYFRIGEVAKLAGIKPYVLRFWETEFPGLGPKKSGTGHRLYRRKDVELVLEIKRLLYEKRYTIEGARKTLTGRSKKEVTKVARKPQEQGQLFGGNPALFQELRRELTEIVALLSEPGQKKK
jgi:DNA-binding transcriptional MerR regulator